MRKGSFASLAALYGLIAVSFHEPAVAQQPSVRAVAAAAPTGMPSSAKGTLLIHGGGDMDSAFVARGLALAGGPSARMLIVPHATGSDSEMGAFLKDLWTKRGAKNVTVLDLADSTRAIEQVRHAAYIFLEGGIQSQLMDSLAHTGVPEAIRERYRNGAVIGGSSAGAAVMSSRMIVGGATADTESVHAGGTQLSDGLGLWPKVIVDQHFVARRRFTRLLAAVLDHPELVGVGIDEDTAVLVSGDQFEVLGAGTVLVIDARGANVRTAATGEDRSATGLKLHVLRDGDRFDLAKP